MQNSKKYWLRGGSALLGLYILVGVVSYGMAISCESVKVGIYSFDCLIYYLPLVIATGPIFETINDFLPLVVIIFINALIWFIVGSVIGRTYGKIKNKNN